MTKRNKEDELYLTEKKLGEALTKIFPDVEWVHNRKVPDSGINNRPDYRSDELMMIVEFDGNRHYQQVELMIKDHIKNVTYRNMGYTVIRVPYFVQLSRETIRFFFGKDMEWEKVYDHGFVDDKCVLGGDFCSGGGYEFRFFMADLHEREPDVYYEIIVSMARKIINSHHQYCEVFSDLHVERVLPPHQDSQLLWDVRQAIKVLEGEDSIVYKHSSSHLRFLEEENAS